MAWVKLDDGFFRNPKVIGVGRDAKLLYLASLCYSGSSLTDGFIPTNAPRLLAADAEIGNPSKAITQLVAGGLWKEVDGGYMIHDYLAFNQSAEKVRANRDAARERMQQRRSPDVRANKSRSSREVRQLDTDTDVEQDNEPTVRTPLTPTGGGEDVDAATEIDEEDGNEDEPTNITPPIVALPPTLERRFQVFWNAYPRRVSKQRARKWFAKHKPTDALIVEMVAAIDKQRVSVAWLKDAGTYIPLPASWLNSGGWEDEISTSSPVQQNETYVAAFGERNITRLAEALDDLDDTFGGTGWVRNTLRKLVVDVPGLAVEPMKVAMSLGLTRIENRFKAAAATPERPITNPQAMAYVMFRDALTEQREQVAA